MIRFVLSTVQKGGNPSGKKTKERKVPECVVTLFTESPQLQSCDGYAGFLTDVVSNAGLNSLHEKLQDWWGSKSSELELTSLDPSCCYLYFFKIAGDTSTRVSVRRFLRLGSCASGEVPAGQRGPPPEPKKPRCGDVEGSAETLI